MAWPPTLDELKLDMSNMSDPPSDVEDDRLTQVLDAAVVFVQRVRPVFNYANVPGALLPDPPPDLVLGTVRLAWRWHIRRRSPEMLTNLGPQMGSARIPSFDPDVERLLGIGRYAGPVFA